MRGAQHFKTLCCIGLPGPAAMVAIAGALHEVIESEWNRIGLFDQSGRIGAGYAEHPGCVPLMMDNIELFHGRDVWWSNNNPNWLARGSVGFLLESGRLEGYAKSDIFNVIERPLGVRWMLDSIQPLETGKLGVQLLRVRGDKAFGPEDARRLTALRPWIAHALRDRTMSATPPDRALDSRTLSAVRPIQQATLVMDQQGSTLFRTEGAEYLISILGGMQRELKSTPFSRLHDLPSPLRNVVRNLLSTARGQEGGVPLATVPTPWGAITVEASWLSPTAAAGEAATSLIAVNLVLREHAVAYAGRVLRATGATPAQVRVGVLLALGKRKPDIAKELGVKVSSVEDSARKLYARLDIHNASEFGTLLWLTGFE